MEDLKAFEVFFAYNPLFQEEPLDLLNDILIKAKKYLTLTDVEAIKKAYEFTRDAHKGILRKSGEPYIIHPLRATQFLMEINPDAVSIQACILHDVIEDTDYTYADIEILFGKEIADICE
jgi:GTP pyrophosphokinase